MGRDWLSSLPTRIAISSKKKLKNRTASTKPSAITATATRISPMAWSPLGWPLIPRAQLNQNATRKETTLPRNTAAAARLRGQPPKSLFAKRTVPGKGVLCKVGAMKRQRYPSDLTDEQWELAQTLIPTK